MKKVIILLVLVCSGVLAQYTDRNLNANLGSGALPATCTVGDIAFRTDVPAGTNMYGCTAANVWTNLGGAAAAAGAAGDVQYNDGAGGFAAEADYNYTAGTNSLVMTDGSAEYNHDGIGQVSTDAILLTNDTIASLDNQEYAPAIYFKSNVWDGFNGDSDVVEWRMEGIGNQRSAARNADVIPNFSLSYNIDGAGWVPFFHSYNQEDADDADFWYPNLFIGGESGNPAGMTSASLDNVGVGFQVLSNMTDGNENIAYGVRAGVGCTTCNHNTFLGHETGLVLTDGTENVLLGQSAGKGLAYVTHLRGTSSQNTLLGVNAGPLTPTDSMTNSICIGYYCYVDGNSHGVLGKSNLDWSVGGYANPDKTFIIADPSSVGSETLTENTFATHVNWNATNDFDDTGGDCAYVHNVGNGICSQNSGNFAVPLVLDGLYRLTFAITNFSGDPTCSIPQPAAVTYSLSGWGDYASPVRTWNIYFRAASTSENFQINCSSDSGDDEITFDNIYLKQVIGGEVEAASNIETSGSLIGGNYEVASAATLALPDGNVFHVTGTTGITAINTCDIFNEGRTVFLIFDGALTVTEGGNLVMAGNFNTGATDTLTLSCDGTNWYEMSRSDN